MKDAIADNLTGDQVLSLVSTVLAGTVVLFLAFGAYKNGFSFTGCYGGVCITLSPQCV